MGRGRAILGVLCGVAAAPSALAQAGQACDAAFRRCVAAAGGGAPGACTSGCYAERAMGIPDPARPPARPVR
jgi:hypothetical protein